MERVVITGVGVVSPLAHQTEATWSALCRGESGGGPTTLFDTTDFPVKISCEVRGWDPAEYIERKKVKEMGRFTQFAVVAAKEAMRQAALGLTDEEKDLTGCIIGVGIGGIEVIEKVKTTLVEKGPSKISPYVIPAIITNLAAGQVSMEHGLRGPSYCTTSACSSGAHAIGEAFESVRRGKAPVMVAGGSEAGISAIGIGGFAAMYALSRRNDAPAKASRPFDKGRDGFVAGEGAGVVVLESLTRARARGARILAEIVGYGASSDAHHLTQPAPDGEGAQRAMRAALRDAGLDPSKVDYINAHGTSTPVGDKYECIAIQRVFGDRARSRGDDSGLWVSSTKGATGHLLGAAGAVEAIVSVLAIQSGVVPPTINVDEQDPECDVFVVPNAARERRVDVALSNSFGFGGTNASLVFQAFRG